LIKGVVGELEALKVLSLRTGGAHLEDEQNNPVEDFTAAKTGGIEDKRVSALTGTENETSATFTAVETSGSLLELGDELLLDEILTLPGKTVMVPSLAVRGGYNVDFS